MNKELFVNESKWLYLLRQDYDCILDTNCCEGMGTEEINTKFLSYPSILKDISCIDFTNVQTMHLSGNEISSVEALSRIEVPNLASMFLGIKFLTNVKVLRKVNQPLLKRIGLNDNFVMNPQLQVFLGDRVEYGLFFNGGGYQVDFIVWIAKMETLRLNRISIYLPIFAEEVKINKRVHFCEALGRKLNQSGLQIIEQ